MTTISILDLMNAKEDVDHIAAIANSTSATATDRLGHVKKTLSASLAEFPDAFDNAATALAHAGIATAQAVISTTKAGEATAAKVQAELARDAAMVSGKVYATTADGLANTSGTGSTNRYFSTVAADSSESLILWLNTAGTAVEQKRYPGSAALPPQHISSADFSVTDEAGNSVLTYENDQIKVLALQTTTLEVLNPVGSNLPLVHLTPYALSVCDEAGNALFLSDELGRATAREYALPDGSLIGESGLNASFHANAFSQIDALVTFGQSNGEGGPPTQPPVSLTQPYNNIMPVYLQAGVYNGTNATPTGFVPALAPADYQEWNGLAAANQVSRMILRDSNLTLEQLKTQILVINAALGGSGIDGIGNSSVGTVFKRDVLFGFNEASRLGKSYNVKAVTFSQGEANLTTTADEYLALELSMYAWINAFAKATTGQKNDVKLLTWQVQENTGPRVAQTIAADQHPNIHVCFPEYCGYFKAGNLGHLDAVGMALTGAYYGLAYKRLIVDGLPWEPLRHKAIEVRGRNVLVTFNRRGLVLDTTRFAAQAGSGFYATDASGNVPVTSVTVSVHGTVTVLFSRDFVGPVTFGYGVVMSGAGTAGHYGGNLRDCDGYAETAFISGTEYPLHNWAILFKEVI